VLIRVNSRLLLSGLLLGLSITTHLTSLLMLPMALFLLPLRSWPRFAAGLTAGLLPFLLLPLYAQSNSPVLWGRPDTLAGWWWLVSAQLYRPNLLSLPPADWPARLAQWTHLLLLIPFGLFTPVNRFGKSIRDLANRATIQNSQFTIHNSPFYLLPLLLTAALYTLYAFTYRPDDAIVLLLPALLLLSVVLGFALQRLGTAAIILPLALLWLNLSQQVKGYYINQVPAVRPAAEELFASVPPGVIIMTPDFPTITALWYFHHVEKKRPDIIVIEENLFQFDWYREQLGHHYPFLEHLAQDDLAGFRQQNSQTRPFCEASLVEPGYLRC
jgi:hypothetical protein